MKKEKTRGLKITLLVILLIMISLAVVCAVYLSDYYHASKAAMNALDIPPAALEIRQSEERIDVIPQDPIAGMIFYPGGKVQYESYVPLLEACAEKGILCVMPKMPGNLAVLDMNAADGLSEAYPQIQAWYLGGHSLGGTIAANYAASHSEQYSGLILLASYSTEDLKQSELRVITIYGSEDGVLNMKRLESCRSNLPTDAEELVIEGGCHAYFGSYGDQDGDGTPTISRESQIQQTAEAIQSFILAVQEKANG